MTSVGRLDGGEALAPAGAGQRRGWRDSRHPPDRHPAAGGLSAVIRYTEHGIPHIMAKDYANLGFGTGWAQAADSKGHPLFSQSQVLLRITDSLSALLHAAGQSDVPGVGRGRTGRFAR
jgi:hypothetical protein